MRHKSMFIAFLSILFFQIGNTHAQTAQELVERADFLIQNSRYEDAIAVLDQAITTDPKAHYAYFKKANCFIGMGRFRNAVQELEKAAEVKVNYFEAYETLGDLYYQMRNAEKAVKNYDLAFQHDESIENKLKYKLEIIDLLYTLNMHVLAKPHIDDANKIVPEMFDLMFLEAEYHNQMGNYQEALVLMEKVIKEVEPKSGNEKYFFEYGKALHFTANYNKAVEVFKNADEGEFKRQIRLFAPEYYLSLAQIYYMVYEYDECESFLVKIVAMQPNYNEAYELQRKLATDIKPKQDEIELQKKIIKTEKKPEELANKYSDLAILEYQNKDYAYSHESCDNSLKYNPKNLNVIFLKAMAEYKMNMADEATEMLGKAVQNPKIPVEAKAKFNFALGLIYENAGELDKAMEAFKASYGGPFKNASEYELNKLFKLKQIEDAKTKGLLE